MNKKTEGICGDTTMINIPCRDCIHASVCKYRTEMEAIRDELELVLAKEASADIRNMIYQIVYSCRSKMLSTTGAR